MVLSKYNCVIAIAASSAITADAFQTFSYAGKQQQQPLNGVSAKNTVQLGMAASGDEDRDGTKITSVNSKEIYFDEKAGRFFETKLVSDDEPVASDDLPTPFASNPFKKPEGSFFDELFNKEAKAESAPPAPAAPTPAAPATEKKPAFDLGGFFEKKAEEPKVAPPQPKVSTAVAASSSSTSESSPSIFDNVFGMFQSKGPAKEEVEPEPIKYDPVTISPDFRVAGVFCLAGLLLDQIPYIQVTLGPLVTLLGLLFLVQTFRVRFVFNEDNQLCVLSGGKDQPGENVVVGGANAWDCDTIVNYDFFPAIGSSPVGPVLVYFKETQTDPKSWNEGPGAMANADDKVKSGAAVPGQVHFFPAVCSAEQICEEFEKRGCGKL